MPGASHLRAHPAPPAPLFGFLPPRGPREGLGPSPNAATALRPSSGKEMAPTSLTPLLTHKSLTPRGTKWRQRRPRTQHSREAMKPRGGALGA